jgi:Uncharacterised protein family (UPF0236)
VTGLFPPQKRDLNLPTEGQLSTHAAEQVVIEAATESFDQAAIKLNLRWATTLDGKQVQRWSERIGQSAVERRERDLQQMEQDNILPVTKANEHALLVIGPDGGRVQMRLKNEEGTRWREDKALTITSYICGKHTSDNQPQKLVSSHLATMEPADKFGRLARLEAERRGIRNAQQVIVMGDGAAWIDGMAQRHFPAAVRIVDWYHATEYLHAAAKAVHPQAEVTAKALAAQWKTMLWEGRLDDLMSALGEQATRLGPPPENVAANDAREVFRKTIGYFQSHRQQMDYPRYRREGWPIGSGVVESGVKLYNKRVKGTEQFWNESGVEAILQLRSEWLNDPTGLHHRLWPPQKNKAA